MSLFSRTNSSSIHHKVVVLGMSGVGKSSICIRFLRDIFYGDYDPTIEDSYRRQITVDDKTCILDIMDTAGADEYESLQKDYMSRGEAFVFVFSITSESSFQHVSKLYQTLKSVRIPDTDLNQSSSSSSSSPSSSPNSSSSTFSWIAPFVSSSPRKSSSASPPSSSFYAPSSLIPLVLVGNKKDIQQNRQVSPFSAISLAHEWGGEYIETSALTGENVSSIFEEIVRQIRKFSPPHSNLTKCIIQ